MAMADEGGAVERPEEAARLLAVVLSMILDAGCVEADAIDAIAQLNRGLYACVEKLELRRRVVQKHGFPVQSRFHYWKLCANVQQLIGKISPEVSASAFYLQLLGISSMSDSASFETTGIEGEIARDVDRTFPTIPFFSGDSDGKRQLGNVLKAVALHATDIGYCQGMNYVAAALLLMLHDPDQDSEEREPSTTSNPPQVTVFWMLCALIRNHGMADIWRNKMPGLSRCIYLYNQLLQIHFNDLYLHLRQIGMHPSFLATQWFVTLFARVFPLPTVARVWDLFLVDGWKMIFRVALAITAHIRPHIIDLDMEQCSEFFRQNPKLQLEQLHIDELLSSALSFKITRKSLHKMEDERNLEYLRLRLQKTPLSYEHSVLFPNLDNNGAGHNQKVTLNFIRSQLEHFDDDVTSDTIVLRQKIEGIDKLLVQATASLYTLSYALTEVTFELEDHLEAKQRLRAQFQALSAIAIAEATAPSPSSLSGNDDLRRRKSLQLWSPAETLTYINNRMYGCFERATRLSMLSTRNSSKQEEDFDEHEAQEREQERRTLSHLEILVPRLAADLKAIQKKIDANDLELHGVQQRYLRLQSECQLAKVRVEEMQQFKDRLSDQMVQLMLETERLKNSKMQQLFAQVDEVNEAQES